jgi:hypothetical protein
MGNKRRRKIGGARWRVLFTRNLAHLPHSKECFVISKEARKCEGVIQANCGFLIAAELRSENHLELKQVQNLDII